MRRLLPFAVLFAPTLAIAQDAHRIGEVDTTFRLLGRNDRIAVERYDDPKVDGVSCYLSRAETGGIKGSVGLAENPSRFSVACRATGPVQVRGELPKQEVVFGVAQNWLWKELRISRLVDSERNVLIYLAWSTQQLSPGGSPFNSVSAVPFGGK